MASDTGDSFIPFPKTPHLSGSAVVDDDQVIKDGDLIARFSNAQRIVVQEKVDGANVSVHFMYEWTPILQKRSGLIGQAEKAQYNVFRDYVFEHLESLFSLLSTRYCLFGEWLWNQHAVSYDSLPSFLLIFDIFDKTTSEWLSRQRIEALIQPFEGEFHMVPNLEVVELNAANGNHDHRQNTNNVGTQIRRHLVRRSNFSSENQEGIYIRVEDETKVVYRCKLRVSNFVPGREDFNHVVNNGLRPQT